MEGFDGVEAVRKRGRHLEFAYKVNGRKLVLETASVVLAVGWVASADALNLTAAGVETNSRGYISVTTIIQCFL